MPQKIRRSLFLISSAFLQFFLAPSSAFAIFNLITEPFRVVIAVVVGFILVLGMSFALIGVSNGILAWVARPDFIQIGYTRPDNPIVQYGWATVRDFVNLFFILVGIIIGIATALRIQQYEIKKLLPRLILVILLINFTPVFCGAIIDAASIIMNFFFTAGAAGFSQVINVAGTSGNMLANAAKSALLQPANLFNGMFAFQLVFVMAFNFIASFVLLIFAMLLMVRHVALWILVILSPLAFFCYILPATKSIWNKWWNQFIQWCFVGVGGAFFLYLSQVITSRINILFNPPGGEFTKFQAGSQMQNLMMLSVPLIVLLIGMFTTMSTSAMGASAVIKVAKKGAGYVRSGVGAVAKGAGKKAGDWAVEKSGAKRWADRKDQQLRERLATRQPFGWGKVGETPVPGPIAAMGRVASRITTWGLRKTDEWSQKKVDSSTAQQQAQINQKKNELTKDNVSQEERMSAFRSAANSMEKVAAYLALLQKKEHRDLDLDERQRATNEAYDIHYSLGKQIIKSDAEFAQDLYIQRLGELDNIRNEEQNAARAGNWEREEQLRQQGNALEQHSRQQGLWLTPEEIERYHGSLYNKIIATASPDDIAKFDRRLVTSADFQNTVAMYGNGNQITALGKEFGSLFMDGFSQRAEEILDNDPDYFHRENYRLYKYSFSNAAGELGIRRLDQDENRTQARPPARRAPNAGAHIPRTPEEGPPPNPEDEHGVLGEA